MTSARGIRGMALQTLRQVADTPDVSQLEDPLPADVGRPTRRRRCVSCDEIARFITPHGLMCREHAMSETLKQHFGDDGWMPVPIHEEGRSTKH